jgi:hypothetical protein
VKNQKKGKRKGGLNMYLRKDEREQTKGKLKGKMNANGRK